MFSQLWTDSTRAGEGPRSTICGASQQAQQGKMPSGISRWRGHTAQSRPNLNTTLSFGLDFPPAARTRTTCLLPAQRRDSPARGLSHIPGTGPTVTWCRGAAKGTPGALSSVWDWTGPLRQNRGCQHPSAGSEGLGWWDTALHPSCVGAGEPAPNRCSTAQGLHP